MFCPTCGIDHHAAEQAAEQAAATEVQLAKINADRDIKIAQISANVTRDTADVDQAAALARAEGEAEGMQTALEGGAGVDAAAAVDGAPIVVDAGEPELEPEPEPEPELAPPVAPTMSSRAPSSSSGWWAGYR